VAVCREVSVDVPPGIGRCIIWPNNPAYGDRLRLHHQPGKLLTDAALVA